jgi:putative NIF3 family GTP cyclohydrolase 1 type 2
VLLERVESACGRAPLAFTSGPARVRTLGIVTGAAAKDLAAAAAAGLDAFLTGEPAEHVMGDARDAGVHFIAAGHYATETFGIRALGELLAREEGVEDVFIDAPNPV